MQTHDQRNIYKPLVGALIGGIVGYIVAELIIEGIYEYEDSLTEEDEETDDEEWDEEEIPEVVVKSKVKQKKQKQVDYQQFFDKKDKKPPLKDLTEKKMETTKEDQSHLKRLTLQEFNELDPRSFTKRVSLRYYKNVDILVNNENDAIIADSGETVGFDNLSKFGYDGHDANELVVLDTETQTLYEIRKTFDHEIFDDEMDNEEPMLGGSGTHRDREEDWDDSDDDFDDDEEEGEN